MKVFVLTDLEGVAGVVSFTEQAYPDARYFDEARKLATAEVNAAVDGMVEVGADDILIWDGHGPGGIWFEDLHDRAKLLHGRPLAPWSVRNEIAKEYDVCMILGQHAMAGVVTGNLSHTQSSRHIEYYKLNGKLIGEIAQFALHMGTFDIPLIFLSGDEDACREVEELVPGITTVSVKKGLSLHSAISVSATESRRRIRGGAKRAIERHREKPLASVKWPGPYVLDKRYFRSDTADTAAQVPGAERLDSLTVRLRSEHVGEIIYT